MFNDFSKQFEMALQICLSSFLVTNSHYNMLDKSFLVKFPWHISKLSGAVFSVKFSIKHEFAET